VDDTYKWLIGTTAVNENETGHFKCWEPSADVKGIDITDSGYFRFSYKGKKILCHRFVWVYHNPGKTITDGYDISHLCGNKRCCRPSHLHCEIKTNNIARIGCMGYIVSEKNPNDILLLCTHNVPCKTSRFVNGKNFVIIEKEI
jgi:hypothetical protein